MMVRVVVLFLAAAGASAVLLCLSCGALIGPVPRDTASATRLSIRLVAVGSQLVASMALAAPIS